MPTCEVRVALLNAYTLELNRQIQDVRAGSRSTGSPASVVRDLEKGEQQFLEARQRYIDHLNEHGC
jgi:hypothetical protein